MTVDQRFTYEPTIWVQWGGRWLWLVMIALALAWRGGPVGPALTATAGYLLLQLGITVWLLWQGSRPGLRWLGLAADALIPVLIVTMAGGAPQAVWAGLLAGAASAGAIWGLQGGVPVAAGQFIMVVLLLGSPGPQPTSLGALVRYGVPLLMAASVTAWVTRGVVNRWRGIVRHRGMGRRDAWLESAWPQSNLPVDGKLDIEEVIEAVTEAGTEALIRAGLPREMLAGVGWRRSEGGWKTTDAAPLSPEQIPAAGAGLLTEAAEGDGPVQGDPRQDAQLAAIAEAQSWRDALCLGLRFDDRLVGACLWASRSAGAFSQEHALLLEGLGRRADLVLQYQALGTERERLNEIQEEARKKLARDLHDGPTQVIAAIAMRTNFARRQLSLDQKAAAEELATVEDMARSTTREIRHMLFTLRPLILESQGLKAALRQFADKMAKTHGQQVLVDVGGDAEQSLSHEQEGPLFYIAEEAVNNARKHAAAECVWIRLRQEEQDVLLEVEDNGVGFNVGAVDAHYEQRGSLGMVTMRERAQLLDGVLEIESEEGRGTLIRARVPVVADDS